MYSIVILICSLLIVSPSFAYVRNQVNGIDGKVWRVEQSPGNNISVLRNDSTSGVPQPGGGTLEEPAVSRLGTFLYVIVRGDEGNNAIWCRRLSLSSLSWLGEWVYINGLTPGAPALTTDGNSVFAAVRGIDNALWYRDITGCGSEVWNATGELIDAASVPTIASDHVSTRIYYLDLTPEVRVYTIGSPVTPAIRAFGNDTEMNAANYNIFNANGGETDTFGWGDSFHKVTYFGDATSPNMNSGSCPSTNTLDNMNRGNNESSICYRSEADTGDSLVQFEFDDPAQNPSIWRTILMEKLYYWIWERYFE